MAVTGLILIGYLLAHMYGNLKIFAGEEAFNDYAHHLRTLGEPILPYSGALWIIRVVLIVGVLAHMYAAFSLWCGRTSARRYEAVLQQQVTYRSPADLCLVHAALGRCRHPALRDLPPAAPDLEHDPPRRRGRRTIRPCGERLPDLVGCPGVHDRDDCGRLPCAARHVERLTTLGANTSSLARQRLNVLAYAVAGVVTVGFLLPPFAILFGFVS